MSFCCRFAFLGLLITLSGQAATIRSIVMFKGPYTGANCSLPTSVSDFSSGDRHAYVFYLLDRLKPNDIIERNWINIPTGITYHGQDTYNGDTTSQCFFDNNVTIDDGLPRGAWRIELIVNGTKIASVPFNVTESLRGPDGASLGSIAMFKRPYTRNNCISPPATQNFTKADGHAYLFYSLDNLATNDLIERNWINASSGTVYHGQNTYTGIAPSQCFDDANVTIDDALPLGLWTVELLVNGKKLGEAHFTISSPPIGGQVWSYDGLSDPRLKGFLVRLKKDDQNGTTKRYQLTVIGETSGNDFDRFTSATLAIVNKKEVFLNQSSLRTEVNLLSTNELRANFDDGWSLPEPPSDNNFAKAVLLLLQVIPYASITDDLSFLNTAATIDSAAGGLTDLLKPASENWQDVAPSDTLSGHMIDQNTFTTRRLYLVSPKRGLLKERPKWTAVRFTFDIDEGTPGYAPELFLVVEGNTFNGLMSLEIPQARDAVRVGRPFAIPYR